MLRWIGVVSGEGGPLLLADAKQLQAWSGAEGTDYTRACAIFDDRDPEPPGGELLVDGRTAIIWEMGGAGTAYVFEGNGGLLIVRAWIDETADIDRLAALPIIEAVTLGQIEPLDALLIVWAPEDGRTLVVSSTVPGAEVIGLAIDGAALVAGCAWGRYLVQHDEVQLASGASARRVHVTLCNDQGTGPTSSFRSTA